MAVKSPVSLKSLSLDGMPDSVRITGITAHQHCDEYTVTFEPPARRFCPHCTSGDCVIKDGGRIQTVRHTPIARRGTLVTFHKRRLFCKACSTSFFERPDWLHPSLRMTNRLYVDIFNDLSSVMSKKAIADKNCVTPSIVTSVLKTIPWGQPTILPETLCIDEFFGTTGKWDSTKKCWDINKYHCNIANGDSGTIIDILPQYTADYLKKYFRQFPMSQRDRVKFFCCDMHSGFISVAREIFPNAHICLDMFHIVSLINKAVDEIRRRLQNDMSNMHNREDYMLLKKSRLSLLTSNVKQDMLNNPNNTKRLEKLKSVFNRFPELEIAYKVLQEFHYINKEQSLISKKVNLGYWINDCISSNIKEIVTLGRSIKHWRSYVQNTWEYHRSNSTCEGLNNKIKVFKRVSYGLHEFSAFRKRMLLISGPMQPSIDSFTIFSEKRNTAQGIARKRMASIA